MKNTQQAFLITFIAIICSLIFTLGLTFIFDRLDKSEPPKEQIIKNGSIVVLEKGGSIRLAKPSEIDSPDINLGVVTVNVTRYSWGGKVKNINTKDLNQ